MNSTIQLRKPVAEDGAKIWKLVKDTGVLDLNSAYCYMMLCRNFRETCVIAELGEEVVGFVSGYELPAQPDTLFVWQIGIASEEQGKGLGKKLLTELLQQNASHKARYWETTISPSNTASRALFAGFAKEHNAEWEEQEGFPVGLFPTEEHEEERWIRIGPFR